MTITIDGYLTQRKLADALRQIVGDRWTGSEVPVPGTRRRWNMAYTDRGGTAVVEYDGDEHYRNALKVKEDGEKDAVAQHLGHRVVRFPYWVQLDEKTLDHFFDLSARIEQDFPHGFITTRIFPASFCELGLERFSRQLDDLPGRVRDDVIASLVEREREHGIEYVVPAVLRHLVSGRV